MSRSTRRFVILLLIPFTLSVATSAIAASPSPQDTALYDNYVRSVEARLSLAAPASLPRNSGAQSCRSTILIEPVVPSSALPLEDAMLSHWRATAFIPDATVSQLQTLLQNVSAYPQAFAPQVVRAAILHQQGSRMQIAMRVRQHHVITVVLDSGYDVRFGQPDAQHGYSFSRSTHIQEIDSPGTPAERPLSPAEQHGFLWRQNTYWTWQQSGGGLYVQVESVSLSRSIPTGLGWAISPYVQSIPRDSLEFTLRAVCRILQVNPSLPPADNSSLERKHQ